MFKIIPADIESILNRIRADYQEKAGKVLLPAHIENSIIQVYAYREYLLREAINHAFLQNFPQFAEGYALDLCGEPMGCFRLDNESDDDYRKRILLAPESFTTCGTKGSYEYHARQASVDVADVFITHQDNGIVEITVLAKQGEPSQALLETVKAYVADDERRTLCDKIVVQGANTVNYRIQATLDLLQFADAERVEHSARQSLQSYLDSRTLKMGEDVVPLDLAKALKVDGVYNVTIQSPQLLTIDATGWAVCTDIQLTINEQRFEG